MLLLSLWLHKPPADHSQPERPVAVRSADAGASSRTAMATATTFPDEHALVSGLRAGDSVAFDQLLDRCIPLATTAAYRILGDVDIARDVASEVLVRIWEQRATFTPASTVAAYVVAAARRRALNVTRDDRRRSAAINAHGIHTPYPGMSVPPATPDVTTERAELSATLARALMELSPRAREIASLRWQNGLSRAEIAESLGITISTVSNTLVTAGRAIRVALGSIVEPREQ
jgi:RNA polymerase sigma-70 factor (ECF subfamily)